MLFFKNSKLRNKRKENFLYIWLLQHITLYQRRKKIVSLDKIAFLDTHLCINNPYWQSSGIIIIFCKYYIVIWDTLIGSCMYFSCCLLQYYQSFIRKNWVPEKWTQKDLSGGYHFFWLQTLLLMSFFVAFLSTHSLSFTSNLHRKIFFQKMVEGLAPPLPSSDYGSETRKMVKKDTKQH